MTLPVLEEPCGKSKISLTPLGKWGLNLAAKQGLQEIGKGRFPPPSLSHRVIPPALARHGIYFALCLAAGGLEADEPFGPWRGGGSWGRQDKQVSWIFLPQQPTTKSLAMLMFS